jgi:chromosome partitioning protein
MLSTSLAVWWLSRGARVKLIDADSQGSALRWATERAVLLENYPAGGRLGPPVFVPHAALSGTVYFGILEEAKHYDVVVVDAGAADTTEFETAAAAANVIVSPIIPSDCDIPTLETVNNLVRRLSGSGQNVRAHVVLNCLSNHRDVGPEESNEARRDLMPFDQLRVATSEIRFRVPFRRAFRQRLSVVECAQRLDKRAGDAYAQAADEVRAVFEEVCSHG